MPSSTAIPRSFKVAGRRREPTPLPSNVAKGCPFCGTQPEVQPWHGGSQARYMVSCPNTEADRKEDLCVAAPSVCGPTKKAAIARWNKRPGDRTGDLDTSEADPAIRAYPGNDKVVLMRVISYDCEDCDLPDGTGAWPDAWVALDEAHEHKRKHPDHRVTLLGEKVT